jgi:Tfp pilus assembly protein PilO
MNWSPSKKSLAEANHKLEGTLMHTGAAREVTRMLRQINEHVAASGLKVVSLQPKGRNMDTLLQLEWNHFQLNLSGSFHAFLHLLESLRAMPDAVRIDGVTLAGRGRRISEHHLQSHDLNMQRLHMHKILAAVLLAPFTVCGSH